MIKIFCIAQGCIAQGKLNISLQKMSSNECEISHKDDSRRRRQKRAGLYFNVILSLHL